jgi:hypothetical protein
LPVAGSLAVSPALSLGTTMTNEDSGTEWTPAAIQVQTAPADEVGTVIGPQPLTAADPDTGEAEAEDEDEDEDDDDDDDEDGHSCNASSGNGASAGAAGTDEASAPAPAPASALTLSAGYAKMLRRQLSRPVDPEFMTSMLKRNLRRQVEGPSACHGAREDQTA